MIRDHDDRTAKGSNHIKSKCSVNNDQYKEIIAYNDIMNFIEKDDTLDPIVWKFKKINAPEGPINKNHPSWQGLSYNVMIEWENGELTSEPHNILAAHNPVICAICYANKNDLLELS